MICPHCGAKALTSNQRYCHECGVSLMQVETAAPPNVVGDGSDRAMAEVHRRLAMEWLRTTGLRAALYAAGITVAGVVALVVALVTIGVILVGFAALALLAAVFGLAYLLVRRHRGYAAVGWRRHIHRYRMPPHRHDRVFWL